MKKIFLFLFAMLFAFSSCSLIGSDDEKNSISVRLPEKSVRSAFYSSGDVHHYELTLYSLLPGNPPKESGSGEIMKFEQLVQESGSGGQDEFVPVDYEFGEFNLKKTGLPGETISFENVPKGYYWILIEAYKSSYANEDEQEISRIAAGNSDVFDYDGQSSKTVGLKITPFTKTENSGTEGDKEPDVENTKQEYTLSIYAKCSSHDAIAGGDIPVISFEMNESDTVDFYSVLCDLDNNEIRDVSYKWTIGDNSISEAGFTLSGEKLLKNPEFILECEATVNGKVVKTSSVTVNITVITATLIYEDLFPRWSKSHPTVSTKNISFYASVDATSDCGALSDVIDFCVDDTNTYYMLTVGGDVYKAFRNSDDRVEPEKIFTGFTGDYSNIAYANNCIFLFSGSRYSVVDLATSERTDLELSEDKSLTAVCGDGTDFYFAINEDERHDIYKFSKKIDATGKYYFEKDDESYFVNDGYSVNDMSYKNGKIYVLLGRYYFDSSRYYSRGVVTYLDVGSGEWTADSYSYIDADFSDEDSETWVIATEGISKPVLYYPIKFINKKEDEIYIIEDGGVYAGNYTRSNKIFQLNYIQNSLSLVKDFEDEVHFDHVINDSGF